MSTICDFSYFFKVTVFSSSLKGYSSSCVLLRIFDESFVLSVAIKMLMRLVSLLFPLQCIVKWVVKDWRDISFGWDLVARRNPALKPVGGGLFL